MARVKATIPGDVATSLGLNAPGDECDLTFVKRDDAGGVVVRVEGYEDEAPAEKPEGCACQHEAKVGEEDDGDHGDLPRGVVIIAKPAKPRPVRKTVAVVTPA